MTEPMISAFSVRFSQVLRGVMRENGVTQDSVARRLGKSKGFVSEHVSGKKAPDTDLVDAVAFLADLPPRELMTEIARRMREDGDIAPVSQLSRKRGSGVAVDPYAIQDEAARDGEG